MHEQFLAEIDKAVAASGPPVEMMVHPDTFAAMLAEGHCGLPISKRGVKTKAWDSARAWLHRQFRLKGIVTCQIRFAGRSRRRNSEVPNVFI